MRLPPQRAQRLFQLVEGGAGQGDHLRAPHDRAYAAQAHGVDDDHRPFIAAPPWGGAAGAKAILDIPKTLEFLETNGVPVIAFGQDAFPAFWSAQSDLPAPLRMDTASDIARAFVTRRSMGLPGGQLIANPIPKDAEIPASVLAPIIAQAQSEADAQRITAKAVTPFLLQRIFELTEGRSLEANIALVRNNAKLAAQIAQELILL